jgi:hypothetical protein
LPQEYAAPIRRKKLPTDWFVIQPKGFDAVYWSFGREPSFSCNGLRIANPQYSLMAGAGIGWKLDELRRPQIAVLDSAANLPVTTQRYALAQESVPFIDDLTRDVLLSFIAHALVCGPGSRAEAISLLFTHPLLASRFTRYEIDESPDQFSRGLLRWCSTPTELVPADPWLYSLLNTRSYAVGGILCYGGDDERLNISELMLGWSTTANCAVLPWHGIFVYNDRTPPDFGGLPASILSHLASDGVWALGHGIEASELFVSTSHEFDFPTHRANERNRNAYPIWQEQKTTSKSPRRKFSTATGTFKPSIPLRAMVEDMEKRLIHADENLKYYSYVLYGAEVITKQVERMPASPLAKLWNECLGSKAIPFDPHARKDLIARASKNRELKRHIDAWKKMKRADSEWTKPQQARN